MNSRSRIVVPFPVAPSRVLFLGLPQFLCRCSWGEGTMCQGLALGRLAVGRSAVRLALSCIHQMFPTEENDVGVRGPFVQQRWL